MQEKNRFLSKPAGKTRPFPGPSSGFAGMRRTVAMPDFQDARHIAENQAGAEDFPAEYGKFS